MLRDREPVLRIAEDSVGGHIDVLQRYPRMVGRHVEGPEIFLDLEAGGFSRDDKAGDALRAAVAAAGAREEEIVRRDVQARVPDLRTVDLPAVAVAHSARLHPG